MQKFIAKKKKTVTQSKRKQQQQLNEKKKKRYRLMQKCCTVQSNIMNETCLLLAWLNVVALNLLGRDGRCVPTQVTQSSYTVNQFTQHTERMNGSDREREKMLCY